MTITTGPARSPVGRREWGGGMLSHVTTAHIGGHCRVCREPVPARSPACLVGWRIGIAHELCGYLRPDEYAPHEVRVEGRRWWSWRCPQCKRDAASLEMPEEGDPMECHRCRPRDLVIGSVVASVTRFTIRHARTRLVVERGTRGLVVGTRETCGALVVRWRVPDVECAVTALHVRAL